MTAFEQVVVDSLKRIEDQCREFSGQLAAHAEADRLEFSRLDTTVDMLATDHHARKKAAETAGHQAGASAGKFWGIIGTVLAALISGLGWAAK